MGSGHAAGKQLAGQRRFGVKIDWRQLAVEAKHAFTGILLKP
jgi:hypothetical protein